MISNPYQFFGRENDLYFRKMVYHEDYDPTYSGFMKSTRALKLSGTFVDSDGKEFEALKGDAETIGGFINEQAGRIMKNKEFITQGNFKLIIESSDKRRVKQVRVLITS